jgi:hypothetical protein
MKTIDVTKRAHAVNALLDKARHNDVLVRAADGTEFFLTAVDDFDEEIARTSQNKKLMAVLQMRAKAPAALTLEQLRERNGVNGTQKRAAKKTKQK